MAILMHEEKEGRTNNILSTFCNNKTPLRLLVKHMPGSYICRYVALVMC